MIRKRILTLLILGPALFGCSSLTIEEPEPYVTEQDERIRARSGTIHGNPKGFVIFSSRDQEAEEPESAGEVGSADAPVQPSPDALSSRLAVNPFLWQASLESLDFMPLAQADSQGGVIITDWYAPSETPDERFKVTVYIRDSQLRADAVKVTVFRQVDSERGWTDAPVVKETASGLEDNILTRARELRLTTTG